MQTPQPAASSEQELVEKLAKILHHYVARAQNIPENEDAGCFECWEHIGVDFMPLIRSYVQAQVAAARLEEAEWWAAPNANLSHSKFLNDGTECQCEGCKRIAELERTAKETSR